VELVNARQQAAAEREDKLRKAAEGAAAGGLGAGPYLLTDGGGNPVD
jgi:hypothetical protein